MSTNLQRDHAPRHVTVLMSVAIVRIHNNVQMLASNITSNVLQRLGVAIAKTDVSSKNVTNVLPHLDATLVKTDGNHNNSNNKRSRLHNNNRMLIPR